MTVNDMPWLPYGIFILIYVILLGITLKQFHSRRFANQHLVFYLLLLIIFEIFRLLNVFDFLNGIPEVLQRNAWFYRLLLTTFTLYFLGNAFLHRKTAWILWVFGAGLFLLMVSLDFAWIPLPANLTLTNGQIALQNYSRVPGLLGWGGLSLAILWRFGNAFRQTDIAFNRIRIVYWCLGFVLVLAGDVITLVSGSILGAVLNILGVIVITIFVLTPKLPDLKDAARKILYSAFSNLFELVFYALFFFGFQFLLTRLSGIQSIWISIGAAAILFLMLNPVVRAVKHWVNIGILGREKDHGAISREFSKSISTILDIKLLAKMIVDLVREIIAIEDGVLYMVDSELGADAERIYRLSGIRSSHQAPQAPGLIPLESPIAKALGQDRTYLTISDIELMPQYRTLTKGERTWLASQRMDIFVPIHANDQWIGLLALGAKTAGTSYTRRDIELLETLADQTAVALQNARLVESLVRVNTQFRRAYSAMEEAHTKLERLDRTKSDFISISSHELRTPLTVLSGYSQMLMDDEGIKKNDYYKKVIAGIFEGTTRLHEIVDSMLEVAKIDTRALELQSQPFGVVGLIKQVCESFSSAITERQLTLINEVPDKLPNVVGDPEALLKVFQHLLSNAVKYTPNGGEIRITGENLPPGNTRFPIGGIEIVFIDTGIGIDPRFKDLIFAKFYQTGELALHSSGKTKFKGGGPGLGLAIVRGIVQAHGGRVWAESEGYDEENPPGSQFHVILPTVVVDDAK